jgi:putative salt-induced outer membrane protein YdiY
MRLNSSIFIITIFFLIFPNVMQADGDDIGNMPVASEREAGEPTDVIKVKDTSGLSEEEVRRIAQEADRAESKAIIKKRTTDENSSTMPQLSEKEEIKSVWEDLSPTPSGYDWIELKSGEWLKGEFKAMYDRKLEFDSKKLKLQTFSFEDVLQIRTYRVVTVSITVDDDKNSGLLGLKQPTIEVVGILRMNGQKVLIIRGDGQLEFQRKNIISIAYGGESERDHWSGKITFGLDVRKGNSEKADYTASAKIQRRTSRTRLQLDYLGNIFNTSNKETANNHRINESFDVFVTKQFYYTPVFSEYLMDKYQNIRNQYILGVGIGYTLIDTKRVDWDVSGGPAILYVQYETVEEGRDDSSRTAALELSTFYDLEVTRQVDFIFSYKLTFSQKDAGTYKHHMVSTLENELTSWLDVDITITWDYTLDPEPSEDKSVPKQSDLQFLVSLGIEF